MILLFIMVKNTYYSLYHFTNQYFFINKHTSRWSCYDNMFVKNK